MWLLDQWAERHILDAQRQGEFDNLPGNGQPLILDDDSHVPADLRAGYRMLKNAGCLPPEIEQRKEAIELSHLLTTVRQGSAEHSDYTHRLALLELKLRQAGVSTEFLHGDYANRLMQKINEE
ncbi:DUF1992 domain-containing protein [Leclercia adecarboxylata]|uniref:DnaJ family domain-containing protein n=1 Tax=Leclercia adecarboxylata TaxID=83655 RepID=UPI00202AB38A|nr:DUF1992 domain-containing protein [Leclercia adecarboxylata]URN98909.1 DUF1992 domain-containing protein [Leclercia adecarboxylata]